MTSTTGKSYPDGCIIFVDPERKSPNNGERVIAKIEGAPEVTFKVYMYDAGRAWLRALNSNYPPIDNPFRVLGTVVGKWEDE
jgi:SOS-response transcriptional repressor LexA